MGIEFGNVARDAGYYLGQIPLSEPTFQGATAKMLGIEGRWDEGQFKRLWDGKRPDEDGMLPGLRNVANRVNAIDITFNHDKPSSLLRLVAEDSRLEDVALKARRKAMKLVEKQASSKIRKQTQLSETKKAQPKGWRFPERQTGNVIYVEWGHPDNREGAPHWHHHVTVLNLTWDRQESQFKTVNLFHLDKVKINDVYHREYAKGMRKLGYKAKWDGKMLDVKGVDREVCDLFSTGSKRAKETQARYADKPLSKQGRAKVQLFDRPGKSADMPLGERQKGWFGQMTGEQRSGVHGVVKLARATLNRSRWRSAMQRGVERLRSFGQPREQSHTKEKGHGHER